MPDNSSYDVSIVTSLYRSEGHLARFSEALVEVATQLGKQGLRPQFIIVSNRPTRWEVSRLVALKSQCLPICDIRVEFVARETLYASWNRGVGLASAPVVCFWNVDDLRSAKALAEGVELIKGGNSFVCFPYIVFFKNQKAYFKDLLDVDTELALHDFVIGPFFMFSKDLFARIGPFDEQFHITGDFEWQFRVAKATPIVRGQSMGGLFVADADSLSAKMSPRHFVERNVIFVRYQIPELQHPLSDEQVALFRHYQVAWNGNAAQHSMEDFSLDARWDRRRRLLNDFNRLRELALWPARRLKKSLLSWFNIVRAHP